MARPVTFLNYLAFVTLFVTSFVFIFIPNSVVLGYILAFITITFFIFFIFREIGDNMDDYTYFIPTVSVAAIIFSSLLHFVALIFVLTLIYKLHVKYTVNNKLPLMVSEPYKTQLYNFNIFMASVFACCSVLVIIVNFRWNKIDINFYEFLKHINLFTFYKNFTLFIALILAAYSLGISIYQVVVVSEFSKLSRQQINPAEYDKSNSESAKASSSSKPSFSPMYYITSFFNSAPLSALYF